MTSWVGSTRWLPKRTVSPISPKASFTAKAGTGRMAGRDSTPPKVLADSAFVTGLGATLFTGPFSRSLKSPRPSARRCPLERAKEARQPQHPAQSLGEYSVRHRLGSHHVHRALQQIAEFAKTLGGVL